jgi:hypothetical protein
MGRYFCNVPIVEAKMSFSLTWTDLSAAGECLSMSDIWSP